MLEKISAFIPLEGLQILLVLFLSFILGLEREEKKSQEDQYFFGGVRVFPLIGLLGYGLALLSKEAVLPLLIGLGVLGGFLLVSFWHKISTAKDAGISTEISGLITYMLGALVYREHYWLATALVVISLFLLELKKTLEGLTHRISPQEILTFTKFLLLTAIILPLVPHREFTAFQLNPFKIWLVVVAVSTVSYASYVLQRMTQSSESILLSAILGGAYSSTIATVVLSKRAREQGQPYLFAGSILIASAIMYLRLILLLAVFNLQLLRMLWLPFLILAAGAFLLGALISRRRSADKNSTKTLQEIQNPLELKSAFLFAFIFLAVLIITHLTITYLGVRGIYVLAGIMGVTDVDPFILGLTQTTGITLPVLSATLAILIASASNNAVKGIYAFFFADRQTGRLSLLLLLLLALGGLLPLFFL